MFNQDANIYMVTSNSTVRNGKLVMDIGAPGELKARNPGIDMVFGAMVLGTCGNLGKYGVLFTSVAELPAFGIFQVRYRINTPLDLELIEYSTEQLAQHAIGIFNNYRIVLNFPGNNPNNRAILSVMHKLPENVTLYTR